MLTINIKNLNRLLYMAVFFMFIMGFLVHNIGLPIGIMALLDAVVFAALLYSLRSFMKRLNHTNAGILVATSAALLVIAVTHALISGVSPSLIIEGFRNNFRGMATFTVAVCLLQMGTTQGIFQLIESFFRINVVVCTIQFFLLGVSHDNCNGLFGAGKMNDWTNILLCVISIYYISQYINKCVSLRSMVVHVVWCLYIAILAELKIYFYELVFIVMILVLLDRPSLRTWIMCIVGGLALTAMLAVFIAFWQDDSAFTLEGLKLYLREDRSVGYASQRDWGRIGGIAKATTKFFSNDLNLFGMGLGYCDFDTPFYSRYSWLHYNWFSYISIFLEQGWVGLIGYFTFFALNTLTLWKKKKTAKTADAKVIYDVSVTMSVLGIVLMVYNSSVTGYPAFFLFLLMGLAYRYELNEGTAPRRKRIVFK